MWRREDRLRLLRDRRRMFDRLVREGECPVRRRDGRLLRRAASTDGVCGGARLPALTRIRTLTFASIITRAEDSSLMRLAGVAVLVFAGLAAANHLADGEKLLKQIKAVSKEGAGNQEAGAAWRQLVALGGEAILPTLVAMDDASPAAANWLRSA